MSLRLATAGASTALLAVMMAGCTSTSAPHAPSQVRSTATASTGAHLEAVPPGRLLFRRYAPDGSGSVLVVSDTHGGHERQLTKPYANVVDGPYNWSPDGSRILFTRHTGKDLSGESSRIFTMSSSGGSLKQLTFGHPAEGGGFSKPPQFDTSGSFSPDGKLIAYTHDDGKFDGHYSQHSSIYVMKPDGSGKRAITTVKDYSGAVSGVGWSPDGTRLLYTFENDTQRALFIVNTDGTGTRRLTDWKLGANGTADWSSTGDLIVFRAVQDEESGIGNLYTIHPDGTGLTQITHLRNTTISHIVHFSPDGQWIASADGPADSTGDVFVARADGSQMRIVVRTPKTNETGPAWAPTG